MLLDTDITWAAELLLSKHGRNAERMARLRVEHLLKAGDLQVAEIWDEIAQRIQTVQRSDFGE